MFPNVAYKATVYRTGWLPKTAQKIKLLFSNVAYRATVHQTGDGAKKTPLVSSSKNKWHLHGLLVHIRKIFGLLICTLKSESQVLEKSRSISKPRKNFRFCKPWFFFRFGTWIFFQVYSTTSAFFRLETWKKSKFAAPEIFLGFEINLDFLICQF